MCKMYELDRGSRSLLRAQAHSEVRARWLGFFLAMYISCGKRSSVLLDRLRSEQGARRPLEQIRTRMACGGTHRALASPHDFVVPYI